MRWLHLRVLRGMRTGKREGRKWSRDNPWITRWLESIGCLHGDQYSTARGIAIGLFIGLTPTVGIQIILMLLTCRFFRANFLAAFAVSWVSNPLTMAPLYYGWNQLGELVFSWLLAPMARLSGISGKILTESTYMIAGSLLMAIPAAMGGYALSLWISRLRRQRRSGRDRTPVTLPDKLDQI